MHKHLSLPLLLSLLLISAIDSNAQRITISGYVESESSRERLVGVNIYDGEKKYGTVSNSYGFFSLTLPAGKHEINFSYLGFVTKSVTITKDTLVTLRLAERESDLEMVDVTTVKRLAESSQMSAIDIDMKQLKKIPVIFGEVDVLRAMQYLPGVQSGTEASVGLYVRGGGPDQNLILLDGVPVYNVSHLFGFYSVFNADAIKSATLIKGGFPARYGGRLSSVIDITMKEGNMREFHGEGSIGIIASKLTLEGPLIKDKTSFMISGRRTYIDALLQPFIALQEPGTRAGYYFSDINLKINHKFSNRDRLYLSFFNNVDKFYFRSRDQFNNETFTTRANLAWGNRTGSLRWNHLISKNMFVNVAATYTRYEWGSRFSESSSSEAFDLRLRSNIEDYGLKADFEYIPSSDYHIRFGANYIRHYFRPSSLQVNTEEGNFDFDSIFNLAGILTSDELSFYAENDWIVNSAMRVNYGLHLALYRFDDTYYSSLQPRVSGRYMLNSNSSVKLSYARMQQFLHLLSSNSGVGLPSDLWVPATNIIPPMMADQVAAGYAYNTLDAKYEFSTEVFYKKMTDLVEYSAGSSFINPNDWQNRVETGGLGWAYGAEVLMQKKAGKTTGWVGYTLSWNNRQFENLNNGRVYPYRFDRRHDVSVVLTYDIADDFDIGVTWVYGTGIATNLPVFRSMVLTPNNDTREFTHSGDLNSFRFPAYHRGDISMNWHINRPKFKQTWNVSIYNVYNRLNAFFIYQTTDNFDNVVFKQVSLFPILPSVSYRISF
jgi:hypothetical protein